MISLITGAGGFVGQWLISALIDRQETIVAFTIGPPAQTGVLSLEQRRSVRWIDGDVRNSVQLERALKEEKPDVVYHLAGVAYMPEAGLDPTGTFETNSLGVLRLLSAIATQAKKGTRQPRVLVVGSAEQYGPHDDNEYPLSETAAQRPLTVYAASKAAQELIAFQAGREHGIPVIATRSFNHSGPGQDSRFLLPALVNRVKELASKGETRFAIGDTSPVRDFLHVRDVVRAYIALIEHGQPGEAYNVSSGSGVSVGEIAERVLAFGNVRATPYRDESLVRRVEVPRSVGDNAKLTGATGWGPQLGLDDIIRDVWEAN